MVYRYMIGEFRSIQQQQQQQIIINGNHYFNYNQNLCKLFDNAEQNQNGNRKTRKKLKILVPSFPQMWKKWEIFVLCILIDTHEIANQKKTI